VSTLRLGRSAERVGFFTDAVLAIAMTLLVLEIPRPEGEVFEVGGEVDKGQAAASLWHFLVDQTASFYSYLLAFVTLWVIWRSHHRLTDAVKWMSPAAISWHLPLLLLIGFLPYATATEGHFAGNPVAALLYGLTQGVLLLCWSIVLTVAYRDDALNPGVEPAQVRVDTVAAWVSTAYWAVTLLLVWWTPWVQIAWFLTFAVYLGARQVMAQRAPRESSAGGISEGERPVSP
jgi:uncharacterized membrane protein